MADVESGKTLTLAEQYLLKGKDIDAKPIQLTEVQNPVNAPREEAVAEDNIDKSPAAPEESADVTPAAASTEENDDAATAAASSVDESSDGTAAAAGGAEQSSDDDAATAGAEESSETTQEDSGDQEVAEETPEIKLETAPADFRFPTTNQTRHCFTRYIEYHRCIAAKGESAPECNKFAKYYRALCPGEWIDRWNEQRENGTFPGPL